MNLQYALHLQEDLTVQPGLVWFHTMCSKEQMSDFKLPGKIPNSAETMFYF